MRAVTYGKKLRDSFTIMISTVSSAAEASLNSSLVISDEASVADSAISSWCCGFWTSKNAIAYTGLFSLPM